MNNEKGLEIKYNITKIEDGSTVNGCFVLRPDKDPAAVQALRAYAAATESKALADDIFAWVGKSEVNSNLNSLIKEIHENAVAHGWWDTEREFGTLLMLITSEAAEALEEYRNGHAINETYYTKDKQGADKMEGVPSELADIIIRVLDICGKYGIDINAAIREKMAYNASRPYKHGGKKC